MVGPTQILIEILSDYIALSLVVVGFLILLIAYRIKPKKIVEEEIIQVRHTVNLEDQLKRILNGLDGDNPQLVEFELDDLYEFQGQKFSKIYLITKKTFEETNIPWRGKVDYMGWTIEHPRTYHIPVYFLDFVYKEGEAIPVFLSLKENWNMNGNETKNLLKDLINENLLHENMKLKLQVRQLAGYIPILAEDPKEATKRLSDTLVRLQEEHGGIIRAAREYARKPIYRKRDFWILVGIAIVIIILVLAKYGYIALGI